MPFVSLSIQAIPARRAKAGPMDSKTLAALGVAIDKHILDVVEKSSQLEKLDLWLEATPMDLHMLAAVQDQARAHREAGYAAVDVFASSLRRYYNLPLHDRDAYDVDRVARLLTMKGYYVSIWTDSESCCGNLLFTVGWTVGHLEMMKGLKIDGRRRYIIEATGQLEPLTNLNNFVEFDDIDD